jgi:hypothetical protein
VKTYETYTLDQVSTIYAVEVKQMASDTIRFELDNLQGLFFDSDDRMAWAVLNAELKSRDESPVRYRSSERAVTS